MTCTRVNFTYILRNFFYFCTHFLFYLLFSHLNLNCLFWYLLVFCSRPAETCSSFSEYKGLLKVPCIGVSCNSWMLRTSLWVEENRVKMLLAVTMRYRWLLSFFPLSPKLCVCSKQVLIHRVFGARSEIAKSDCYLLHVCPSVCLLAWNNLTPTGRILTKFWYSSIFRKSLPREFKLH